ncbi:CDP-glycerol glycerophosphotransferase family protein [Leucobacter sp. cx-42]|uniref:CDP-glycerol glycerophosphotransferase family protein n=1 Tax=unclassified Leucobacter TaxID=2621730 RepID=UPI00165DF061|nr:CDP-glycerol glycerophosphotransferase family protein [Leucobacter sp. cx-42]
MRNSHLWLFNCANTFSGNPKWLFLYIAKYRKDIRPVWISDAPETSKLVRGLGYEAVEFGTMAGLKLQHEAGVFVVNQVKEIIPDAMTGITLLNLWHGVGVKKIERAMTEGDLLPRIAAKYIRNNKAYRDTQLFLVPSKLMEGHFAEQIEFAPAQVLRGGYPQNTVPQRYRFEATFDHDVRARNDAPGNARIAVYAPTYRLDKRASFLGDVLPDFERLESVLKAQNTMLIFKMHPSMENDAAFLHLKDIHADSPWLYFWDGAEDIYEMFDEIDLAIVDYSSMLYDFIAGGVKNFIRYIPDYAEESGVQEHALDYLTHSCGTVAETFDELLAALEQKNAMPADELTRLTDLFWGYTEDGDLETMVNAALNYKKLDVELPDLYSFDVFDTLIHRSTVSPESVFQYVQHKIRTSGKQFPADLIENYSAARRSAETAARDNRRKRPELRRLGDLEIQFSDIFAAMTAVYDLDSEHVELLQTWEIEGELRVVVPDEPNVAYLKSLLERGEIVVLISDMYLPYGVIRQLLASADPVLAELPLYLSTVERAQKTTGWLYVRVYLHQHRGFHRWFHVGDNELADGKMARKMGIIPELLTTPEFDKSEENLLDVLSSFDMHQVAALFHDYRRDAGADHDQVEDFVFRHVSLYLVPYVAWSIDDAIKRGYETLYFVSRDGHHLKIIADAIIAERGIDLATKYIYGSRTSWRLASQFDGIDKETFSPFGSFGGVRSYAALLKAAHLTTSEFLELFPAYAEHVDAEYIDGHTMGEIVMALSTSTKYRERLAEVARDAFDVTAEYLLREIDLDRPFGIVEYWGRGYTQDCLVEILEHATGVQRDIPFYYARSIYPTEGHSIRHNFTVKNYSLLVIEAIFANMPHGTVEGFERQGEDIVPVVTPREYDEELFEAMERLLPEFARRFARLEFLDPKAAQRDSFHAAFEEIRRHPNNPAFRARIAHLRDAVQLGGAEREFAPAMSTRDFASYMRGRPVGEMTSSLQMSVTAHNTVGGSLFKLRRDVGLRRIVKPQVAKIADVLSRKKMPPRYTPEQSTQLADFYAELAARDSRETQGES